MKNLIIVGTGAVAAENTCYVTTAKYKIEGDDVHLKGYIGDGDDLVKYYRHYGFTAPILGGVNDYQIEEDDRFIIAINNSQTRRRIADSLRNRGAKFANLIHPSSVIAEDAVLGEGNIISPFSIIGPKAVVGNFNGLTSYSAISHDCVVGSYNSFSSVVVCGYCHIGDNNTFYIKSTVAPSVTIGSNCIIQAGMMVDKDVPDGTTVFYKYKERILAVPTV
ncbi:MAG: acetyltransferase [Aeriscardovia sp.]|nr:acetyltransferase [Aeriscardovia sp.]MBO6256204.1 acetyltransferase [Bacteroidaceae bacterium]